MTTNNETKLLRSALLYENGHPRRTQHILKVYALAKLLGENENLSKKERQILQAAAILHDIAIKYCKEHYDGNACQENQQREAPALVNKFLLEAGYEPEYIPEVTEAVKNHHNYDKPRNKILQLLVEADLIINCFESSDKNIDRQALSVIFETKLGKELFTMINL